MVEKKLKYREAKQKSPAHKPAKITINISVYILPKFLQALPQFYFYLLVVVAVLLFHPS